MIVAYIEADKHPVESITYMFGMFLVLERQYRISLLLQPHANYTVTMWRNPKLDRLAVPIKGC